MTIIVRVPFFEIGWDPPPQAIGKPTVIWFHDVSERIETLLRCFIVITLHFLPRSLKSTAYTVPSEDYSNRPLTFDPSFGFAVELGLQTFYEQNVAAFN